MKKLIIHTGFPKTGSSFIQAFLTANKDLLKEVGLFYECPDLAHPFEISSGNAAPLYHLLQDLRLLESQAFLANHTSQDMISILSCEALSHLKFEDWNTLKFVCAESGIKIEKIIFYVRDVLPFFKSAYDQGLKRHGVCCDFQQFLVSARWSHYEFSRIISQVFGSATLVPLHYETCKDNLLGSFFSQISCGTPELHKQILAKEKISINRSLTEFERDYLIKINSKMGALHSQKLSDFLIYRNPTSQKANIQIDTATRERIQHRFQEQVDWVNLYFFGGKSVVSCSCDSPSNPVEQTADKDALTHRIVAEFILEEFTKSNSETVQKISDKLLAIIKQSQPIPPGFPEGFSILEYVLLNQDVLLADVNPVEHYQEWGCQEGRRFKL